MAAPDNRVPVRLARGTKATLDANIADLYEGEICYATDENICYVKEGSALEPASGGATSLGGLSDVDLATPATDGQVLIWSAVDSAFLPGDAANPVVSINDLSDVDIATVAPTEGQALVWNATDSEFQPGDVSTAVAFADLTDYEAPVSYTVYDGVSDFTGNTGGIYYAYGSSRLAMNVADEAGLTLDDTNIAQVNALVELSTDGGVTWGNGITVTNQHALPSAGFGFWRFDHDGPADWPANIVGVFDTGTDLRLRWDAGSASVGDGDILVYNTTNSTWQPVPNTPPTVEGLSNTSFGNYAGNTTYVDDATPDANAGEWYMANGNDYIAYNNAQSGAGKMGELQVGDSVTITYSDDSTETLEVQAAEADNSAGSKFIRFTTNVAALVASGGISISSGRFGAVPGEVLTWDGTAWVSTTPAAAISELDDIANVDAKVTTGTSFGRYASFTANPPAANGEWRAESYNELRLFFTDSDGVDVQSAFDALPTSGSIWIVPDGDFGNVTEVTYAGTTNQTTYGRFTGTNIDDAINTYSEIAVYTTLPSESAPADGQVISYSTSESKWTVSNAVADRLVANSAPASPTSEGTAGEIRFDASYIYVATDTNSWKRALLEAWVAGNTLTAATGSLIQLFTEYTGNGTSQSFSSDSELSFVLLENPQHYDFSEGGAMYFNLDAYPTDFPVGYMKNIQGDFGTFEAPDATRLSFDAAGFSIGSNTRTNTNGAGTVATAFRRDGKQLMPNGAGPDSYVYLAEDVGMQIIQWVPTGEGADLVRHGMATAPDIMFWSFSDFDDSGSNGQGPWYYNGPLFENVTVLGSDSQGAWRLRNLANPDSARQMSWTDDAFTTCTSTYFEFNGGDIPPEGVMTAIAFKNTPGVVSIGVTAGAGGSALSVDCGFQPKIVWFKPQNGNELWQQQMSNPANSGAKWGGVGGGWLVATDITITGTGFDLADGVPGNDGSIEGVYIALA